MRIVAAFAILAVCGLLAFLQKNWNDDWYIYLVSPSLCIFAAGLASRMQSLMWFLLSIIFYILNHAILYKIYSYGDMSSDGLGFMLIFVFGLGGFVCASACLFLIYLQKTIVSQA